MKVIYAILRGDLRQRLTIANLISATIDAFDEIDILVNASRQVMETDALNPEDTSVEQLLEQNLMTALRLSQQVARRMIKQAENNDNDMPAGSIINLSSIAAHQTRPELLGYSIASAGLEQMTRSMALALAPATYSCECGCFWICDVSVFKIFYWRSS